MTVYRYPDSVIQVFCKAPMAGQVKTRLLSALTAEQACLVHIELTERLLKLLDAAALCPIQLWCSPSTEFDFFQQQVKTYKLSLQQQQGSQLGERMNDALNTGLQNFNQVLLVGCDCPSLTADDFAQAIEALKQNADVVLAPAEDGGYVLIGVKKAQAALLSDLEMPWGSSQVLAITRQRIQQLQLNVYELRLQWDVDRAEDWVRFNLMKFEKGAKL
jgi:rSAM/selenodomain-associated transferase 1